MIYRKHKIMAEVQTWDIYELNEDATFGDYMGEGGGDTDYPMYSAWTVDENGELNDNLGEHNSITDAKAAIDSAIAEAAHDKG